MPSADRWLLRDVRISGVQLCCRLRDGRIAEIGARLQPLEGELTLEGRGGALIPGLADHHLHLRAAAAALRSVDLRGGALEDTGPDLAAAAGGTGWLRVIGAGTELTRADLDARWPDRPVRAQHRSGALWTLNSAALARLRPGASAQERATGQFWRAGQRLRDLLQLEHDLDVSAIAANLAAHGVTHVTDATPGPNPPDTAIPQHVLSLASNGAGPLKIVIADHDLPSPDDLAGHIARAHAGGRAVAVHAVSAVALALCLAAFDAAGSTGLDRVEHAAVCDDQGAVRLAELGITVVTQPTVFARHARRFLAESEPAERPWLWRYAGLLRAGVRVAVSSDAPYGDASPWRTIQAAAARTRTDGEPDQTEQMERVAPGAVLSSMLTRPEDPGGSPRLVTAGSAADLCLLDADLPVALELAASTGASPVAATFIAGQRVYPPR
jgi:predicted amidohydrolase YtcJ